jgi:hypothetical protein
VFEGDRHLSEKFDVFLEARGVRRFSALKRSSYRRIGRRALDDPSDAPGGVTTELLIVESAIGARISPTQPA